MSTRAKQNARSQKAKMRDALRITESNLTKMIGSQFTPSTVSSAHFVDLMKHWRDMCRRALGEWTEPRECICARCGIRHGTSNRIKGDF
ncbi:MULTISPECIES: hypothetical protein [Sphingomonas]|uniref:hypothetical protein n=1 Tax=Sphingomonas TaxID=13687 RepID=UPI00254E05CF|nr:MULTISPECIES: hypothetical protein [Sphingomonas]MDK8186689.1 hypothetical protein [Sphingomonas zeae]MDK8216354.1 hypothetical protein [Sphingomonas sp. UMB7805-LC452B]